MRTIKMRAHLNADALFATIRNDFGTVSDHRAANASIPLADALMCGFVMFSLKDPSLLAFDERRLERPESLHGIYGVEGDSQRHPDEHHPGGSCAGPHPTIVPQCLSSTAAG